jgi:hypothetical protein
VTAKAKGKKKFLKIFIITLLSLIIFSLVAFWVVTSSTFITGVILPAVSDSIELQIDAEEVEFSLFDSRLKAKKLLIWSGKTPILKAESLDANFSLSDLINGRFVFRDVILDKAVITIAKDSDGRWNYESPQQIVSNIVVNKTISSAPSVESENDEPEKIFLDLKNIQIKNSSFVLALGDITKASDRIELHDLNINLPEFKNNSPSILTLKSRLSIKSNSGITVEHGEWNASLTAAFDDYLHPYEIKLDSNLNKLDGTINGVKINNSHLTFNIDGQGNKKSIVIKKFILRQTDKEFIKTNLELSSYINFEPFKIKGKLKIAPLSSELSSVLCQFTRQINPGKIGASLISDFEYSNSDFSSAGKLRLTRRGDAIIAGKKYKLPNIILNSKYDFSFDHAQKSLYVKHFNTELKDRGKTVLLLSTDRAFTYFFNKQSFLKKRKPQISLELRKLDLSLIRLLQPPDSNFILHNGQLDGDIVCILDHKRKMRFGANLRADDLDLEINSKRFKNLGFEKKLSGFISQNLFLTIPKFHLKLKNKQKDVLSFGGAANIDFKKNQADFSLNLKDFSSNEIANLPLPSKTINEITGITNKLDAFSLVAMLSGNMNLDKGIIKLNPVNFNVFQNNKKVLNLSVQPYDGLIENFTKKSTSTLTVNNLSIKQVKKLINDQTLTNGYINGKVIAKVKDDLNNISVNSSLTINKLELLRMKKIFKNLRFNLGFSASLINFDDIKIQEFVCGMREKKKTILGFSGFGNLKLSEGSGKLDLALDYLNHKSLNIIAPGKLKNGILKGKLDVDIKEGFKNLKIKSHLNMMQFIGGSVTEAVGGKSSFDIELKPDLFLCKEFHITVNNKNGEIITVNGSTILPQGDAGKEVIIKLSSKVIDIDKIKQLFEPKDESLAKAGTKDDEDDEEEAEKAETTTEQSEPLEFDFGTRTYVLLMDLRGIKHSSVLTAHLNSKIIAKKRNISVKHLEITSNKDKVNFQGDFVSTPKGIKYDIDLKSDKIDLNPIFHTFLRDDLKKMKGVVKNLDIKLAGTGLLPVALWDNMKGSVRSDFENVKIPNDLSKTSMGKIFLLPFEIMVDIQKMIPDKAVQAMGQAARYVLEFQRDMKVLKFTDGKMRLDTSDGIIRIIDFHLNGKIVKSFSFAGKFGLGSRELLDLKSRLNINGIVLPVEMSGTVDKPKINYSATTLRFMGANASFILGTTSEILEKGGGDAKKILDIIFK